MDEFARPIITRAEARAKGLSRYFTGKMCINGHITERYVKGCFCTGCRVYNGDSQHERPQRQEGRNGNSRREYREAFLEMLESDE